MTLRFLTAVVIIIAVTPKNSYNRGDTGGKTDACPFCDRHMRRFDQTSATCQIFTYKEGPLSVLAHDLRINVTSFVIELGDNDASINARFDAGSLRVDCAMADGVERRDLLGRESMKEIDDNILKDVLAAAYHRYIFFCSSSVTREDSSYRIRGTLTLRGREKDMLFTARDEDGYYVAEARFNLPDFGIKPFSALFGAIRIKPDILIKAALPLGEKAGLSSPA
jgi:hypothetical protein